MTIARGRPAERNRPGAPPRIRAGAPRCGEGRPSDIETDRQKMTFLVPRHMHRDVFKQVNARLFA